MSSKKFTLAIFLILAPLLATGLTLILSTGTAEYSIQPLTVQQAFLLFTLLDLLFQGLAIILYNFVNPRISVVQLPKIRSDDFLRHQIDAPDGSSRNTH